MKPKSEVIQMRKWLGLSLFFIFGAGIAKADTVNCLGGGCPAVPVSLSSSASGVTAGAYTNTNLTVDVNGRITAAANGTGGGGGAATASLNVSTNAGAPYTTVSSLTVISPVGGPLVRVSGSSATVDLSSVAMTVATQTFSGGALLLQPTTIQTILQSPSLQLIAMNAYTLPFVLGSNAAGTDSGIGLMNGNVSTYSVIIGNSNSNYLKFGVRGKDLLTINANSGGVAIGSNTVPTAAVSITTGAGYTGRMLDISSGTSRLFEVTGTSITAALPIGISSTPFVSPFLMANQIVATNSPADTQVPKYNAATGQVTWSADNTGGGSSGLPLAEGATNYINSSTTTTGGVFHISSGTVESTLTVKGGLIMGGNGAAGITPQVGTVLNIFGDMAFPTTWYTGVKYPTFCGTSTMTIVNVSTPSNGLAWMDGLAVGSGTFAPAYYAKKIPKTFIPGTSFVAGANINPSTPTITDFTDYSSGTVIQNRAYLVSFATAADATQVQNLVYTSTVVYVASGNVGVNGGFVTTKTIVPLNGLINILGSGGCVLWIRVARDGSSTADAAQSFSAPADIGLTFKVQQ